MQKSQKLTLKVVLGTYFSIAFTAGIYCIVLPLALAYTQAETQAFWFRMIVACIVGGSIATSVVYFIYKPIAKAIKLFSINEEPSDSILNKAFLALERMPGFLLYFGSFAYLVILGFNYLADLLNGTPMPTGLILSRIVVGGAGGLISGIVTARLVNMVLIDAKLSLKILSLDRFTSLGKKVKTTRSRLMISGIALFLYLAGYGTIIFYNYSRVQNEITISSLETIKSSLANNSDLNEIKNTVDLSMQNISAQNNNNMMRVILIFSCLFIIVGVLFFLMLSEIQSHLNNVRIQILKMSIGAMDLTKRTNIISFDDIGSMTGGINKILDNLSLSFRSFRDLSISVHESGIKSKDTANESLKEAKNVSDIIVDVDKASASQIETIAVSVNVFNDVIKRINESIYQIDEQTKAVEQTSKAVNSMVSSFESLKNTAIKSEVSVRALVELIESANEQTAKSLIATEEITESGKKVSAIVRIITDIADQSNILAMNAAIEASHAGSLGNGFSVVAREMKKLSETTMKATSDVNQIISELQNKNEHGMKLSLNLKSVFEKMKHSMKTTADMVAGIAIDAKNQSQNAEDNLNEIKELLRLTVALKEGALSQKNANSVIQVSIKSLDETSSAITDVNKKLNSGLSNVIGRISNLNNAFDESFTHIDRLQERIALYKMD